MCRDGGWGYMHIPGVILLSNDSHMSEGSWGPPGREVKCRSPLSHPSCPFSVTVHKTGPLAKPPPECHTPLSSPDIQWDWTYIKFHTSALSLEPPGLVSHCTKNYVSTRSQTPKVQQPSVYLEMLLQTLSHWLELHFQPLNFKAWIRWEELPHAGKLTFMHFFQVVV